jgi:hypothetical protein
MLIAGGPLARDAVGDAAAAFGWSAYDPTEGRLDSDDPLGFAAAALRLADRLLPGLTVRTVDLGYYPMICAGLLAVDEAETDQQRRLGFLIWEKLWALARVSAGRGRGVLGVNGAGRHLASERPARLDGQYVLLQRQAFTGALGAYGTSVEALALKRPGSLVLTDAGRALALAAFKEATTRYYGNLIGAVRESIRSKRDKVRDRSARGVSHDYLAAVGRLNQSITTTLGDSLFDESTTRGLATRRVLSAIRDARSPDLAALHRLASNSRVAPNVARTANQALAIEGLTCAANFALERVLATALSNGYVVPVAEVAAREVRWSEIEELLHARAGSSAAVLADADFPAEHAAAAAFSELTGAVLVRELLLHHDRVMAGRGSRRWAALEGDEIHAFRIQPVPERPELIRHSYRFAAARALAGQAGLIR